VGKEATFNERQQTKQRSFSRQEILDGILLGSRLASGRVPLQAINLDFVDFGSPLLKNDNFFINLLRERFDARITDDPDFLVYSHASNVNRLYTCKKIYWTSEAYAPNWLTCDYALTCHIMNDPRHLRLPLYAVWVNEEELIKEPDEADRVLPQKKKFCAFFSSYIDRKTEHRARFFHLLSRYKRVDAGGKAFRNIAQDVPYDAQAKRDFLKPYKFYMAFENQSLPGYTTEKIAEAMLARCVPIFWGNPRVIEEFNPRSFINANDFPTLQDLADYVAQVDQSDELYSRYLREPYFLDNKPNLYFDKTRILDFFGKIFADTSAPRVAHTRWLGRWIVTKRNRLHKMRINEGSKPGPVAMRST
jgi:alpha(1,3/1,4) fucosyltransferase